MRKWGTALGLAVVLLGGTAWARQPLVFELRDAQQQGDFLPSQDNGPVQELRESSDPGKGVSSLLDWVNGQLDAMEDLLETAVQHRDDSQGLQRQNAFRIQDTDALMQNRAGEQVEADRRGSGPYAGAGSTQGYSQTMYRTGGGGDGEDTTVEVEQNPDGSVTTTTTTTFDGGRFYEVDRQYPVQYTRQDSSSSSSGGGSEGRAEEYVRAQAQSAFDAHVEERMRMLEQQEREGTLSPAKAEQLRAYLVSQAYVDAWVQDQQQQEQQRQMGLMQLMQQHMLQQQRAAAAWQQQQQQEEEEEQVQPQQMMLQGGPVFDLLDLLLAPFQEEASGCRHRRQQQQQQEAGMQEPFLRVTFMQDGDAGPRIPVPSRRAPPPSRPQWHLLLLTIMALLLAASITFQAVKQVLLWRRERRELQLQLLGNEVCKAVCGGGIVGAKSLPAGKGDFSPPQAPAEGKQDEKPAPPQHPQQQQQQSQCVSNIVFAADHL